MDLTDALRLGEDEVVAFVGGGGKTTAVFRLCHEAVARGRRAIATGTARFSEPRGLGSLPAVVAEDEGSLVEGVKRALAGGGAVIAASSRFAEERFTPVSEDCVARLAALAGLVALEADGARMRPFKAPAEHEPVLPHATTLVVAVAGADVFGTALDEEHVHRPERVEALTGARAGAPITPALIAAVLASPEGGRKGVPTGARFAVLINKVTEANLEDSRACARLLVEAGVSRVVLGRLRDEASVLEVFEAP